MKIKICGLRREEDIACVNRIIPEYVGFVFAKSKRQVTEAQAKRLKEMLSDDVKAVGVFVNEKPENIVSLLQKGIIDIAQLHGQETEETIREIQAQTGREVWKAVSVQGVDDILKWADSAADMLVLDYGKGGTGQVFDWEILKQLSGETYSKPFFLAGGLCLENVKEAMLFSPFGLDVSGGVETDGVKDPKKIETFIKIVREERKDDE